MAAERHRAAVGHVGKERAERDHHLYAKRLREVYAVGAERETAHRRLYALDEHEIPRCPGRGRLEDLDGRPHDLPSVWPVGANAGTVGLEVVELLGVEAGGGLRPQRRRQEGDCARW